MFENSLTILDQSYVYFMKLLLKLCIIYCYFCEYQELRNIEIIFILYKSTLHIFKNNSINSY